MFVSFHPLVPSLPLFYALSLTSTHYTFNPSCRYFQPPLPRISRLTAFSFRH
ncbi:hypothetical protein KsCSTR_41920 [Candidatus Kuenenia stuttgartiensis]|uniref:Uncharacterized protein n=1 Tax=Kuenenia stuttgartiensis TaxID=174633 RepID=Q1PXJ4_KUEST|nr:hypothetical protein KsCSTR_41920 [Candidatus Kuenenia stuttgartiensis]CAJ71943.1 unknown protein [Candidatus Kuenenia stuttgartiensis]CAJ72527.1 unknown protein [Candidatus Kuenenia stuttgartiensis]CAJ75231.1 unknown protein [Candidatus Kuenenia stuttgartiensis]